MYMYMYMYAMLLLRFWLCTRTYTQDIHPVVLLALELDQFLLANLSGSKLQCTGTYTLYLVCVTVSADVTNFSWLNIGMKCAIERYTL